MKHILTLAVWLFILPGLLWGQDKQEQYSTADTVYINALVISSKRTCVLDPDSALILLNEALVRSRQIGFTDGIASAYLGMGTCMLNKKEFLRSKELFSRAAPYCRQSSRASSLPMLYNNFAAIYSIQGNYDSASHYYYKALDAMAARKRDIPQLALLIYANLGGCLVKMEQIEQSLYYSRKAAVLALYLKDTVMLGKAYTNIGNAYQLSLSDSAYFYWSKARAQFATLKGYTTVIQDIYYGMGRLQLGKDNPRGAMSFFDSAVSLDQKAAGNNSALLQGIGAAYFKMGASDKAIPYYQRALKICEGQGLKEDKLTIYQALSLIYAGKGQYLQAFENQKKYAELRDTLLNEDVIQTVNQLEVKFRTSEKDKEIAGKQLLLAGQQNRIRNKNSLIAGVSGAALLLGVLLVASYRIQRHRQRLQQEQIRNLNHQQEIMQLKAKMKGEEEERNRLALELHDGIVVQFSAVKMKLNVLSERHTSLEGADDFRQIIRNLDHATRELRKTAHNLMPDILLESGLSEAIFYFCKDIQQSTGLEIDFQQYVDLPPFQPEFELSLYRILQELLQNIIKHASASQALIQLSYVEGILNITVEDNGVGFIPEKSSKKGIGLSNIQKRVAVLQGHMDMQSRPGKGTTVYLEFDNKCLHHVINPLYADKSSHNG